MDNRNAKSLLAKLMAAEDINVEYSDKAVTASFDTESRTLRMPVFKDISDDSTDLFLGHEVGHALYTPQGEIHKVLEKGGTYKNFVNIVEDARIEKMIQNKFPGLRRCFFGGYNELMERDFFGTNGQDINEYNFIDRLNIHFKAGVRAGVDFSAEESIFVNRMENLRSWEDTIALSDDLYEYCKAREEEPLTDKTSDFQESAESDESESEDSQMDSDGSGEDTKEEDSSQSQGDSGKETDGDSGSDSESDTDDNRESDSESDTGGVEGDGTSADNGTSTSGKKGTDSGSADELTSKTQESFDSKLEDLVDSESIRTYYNIPNVDLDKVIVPMSEIHQNIDKGLRDKDALDLLELASKKFKEFSNEQKSIISYLIKEFEMRKSADEHKRTKVARTGILNPNKLHAFKFSEDIFLRNSVVSDGKNHGFVMFVDWSGSMISQMADTIDQLMMLALFCKKAQIPFDVYAFTTAYGFDNRNSCGGFYQFDDLKEGDLGIIDNFNLLHLISSTLKTSAFNRSMTYVSYLRHMFAYHTINHNTLESWELIGDLGLGGTPLNEAIITAMSIVPQFQKNNNVQIVNTIFLTDGQGQNKQYRYEADTACFHDPRYDRNSESVIVDPVTKKHYNSRVTDKILLEILKDRTGTTLAGFFISTSNKKSFSTDCWHMNVPYDQVSRLWDSMKANGFCVVETNGYDEYYILASKNLRIENNGLDGIKSDMTKGKMKNAFVKAQQGKIANKKMLSKFAELVA